MKVIRCKKLSRAMKALGQRQLTNEGAEMAASCPEEDPMITDLHGLHFCDAIVAVACRDSLCEVLVPTFVTKVAAPVFCRC